jgi:hypothetical protein
LEQEVPKIINTDNRSQPYRIDMFMSLGFESLTTMNPGALQSYFYFPMQKIKMQVWVRFNDFTVSFILIRLRYKNNKNTS